jgi:hypothetical protein
LWGVTWAGENKIHNVVSRQTRVEGGIIVDPCFDDDDVLVVFHNRKAIPKGGDVGIGKFNFCTALNLGPILFVTVI